MKTIPCYQTAPLSEIFQVIEGDAAIQGSQAWKLFRKEKIGASYAGTLANANPYQTCLQLWEEMLLGKDKPVNRAMQRGKDEEPKARDWFCKWQQRAFDPVVLQSVKWPFMIASLDGFIIENGEPIILEIKTPGLDNHLLALSGEVPEPYLWQIYFQMIVSGARKAWYVSWDGENGICIEVRRDDEKLAFLLEQAISFMDNFNERRPPKATERDKLILHDLALSERAEAYRRVSSEIEGKEKERELIRKELIDLAKTTHPRLQIGNLLQIQRVITKGRIKYDSIPVLKGIDLEGYRGDPIESYRIDLLT